MKHADLCTMRWGGYTSRGRKLEAFFAEDWLNIDDVFMCIGVSREQIVSVPVDVIHIVCKHGVRYVHCNAVKAL